MRARFLRISGSLQAKFMIPVGILLVLLVAIVSVAVNARLTSLLLRETRKRAVAIAHSIGATTANSLLNYDYVTLGQAAEKAVQEEGIAYVIVLDKENTVAAHSEQPGLVGIDLPAEPGEDLPRSDHHTHRFTEIDIAGVRTPVIDVSHGVFVEGSDVQWGTVRVGLDLRSVHREIRRVRLIIFAIGIGAVLIALLGTRLISRKISASIDDLVRGTIAVSRGNLDNRIEIDTGDEIATLAEHFNHMTAQVKKQKDEIAVAKRELEVLNATLEEKVAKRTREFLASEEKYRILVENSPDPILIVQDGQIRFVNPAFEKIFGYELGGQVREELAVENLFHQEDREEIARTFVRILDEETVDAGEIRGVTRSGEVRLFEMRGMRIHYLGQPAAEIILMDMTERKELQEHLLQHEKLRALGELASGVAHDFNNILGIILGRAQILQRKVADAEVKRGLRTIERAAFDGGETVRRIQDFARSRKARDFEVIDVNKLLEEVVEITRTRWKDEAELRNVKIDIGLELGSTAKIKGNASELREVYTNLIFNAVDAMPEGGSIHIRCVRENGDAVVEVRDTGTGMEEHVRARIFDPFFTTKGTKGMGLGMSVVYGIIERHGGQIGVDSDPGKGTCFTIRIPAATEESTTGTKEPVRFEVRPGRILVIDDEEEILELVRDILEAGDYTVETASSGPRGLELLESGDFDMVLCDLGMRDMSGWEVVTAVRSRDPEMGVALVTGWGATLSEEQVAAHGVDAVLNKPFEMRKLLATVARVLESRDRKAPGATTG